MKKLNILFLSALTLGLSITSCNKDDENDSIPTIEAKWEISKEGETLTTLTPVEKNGSCPLKIIEFVQGGIYKNIEAYGDACTIYTDEGKWTKKDNTITITDNDDQTILYEIAELTESTLKLKETDSEGTWYTIYIKK